MIEIVLDVYYKDRWIERRWKGEPDHKKEIGAQFQAEMMGWA